MAARLLRGEVSGFARIGAAVAVRRTKGSHMVDKVLDPEEESSSMEWDDPVLRLARNGGQFHRVDIAC